MGAKLHHDDIRARGNWRIRMPEISLARTAPLRLEGKHPRQGGDQDAVLQTRDTRDRMESTPLSLATAVGHGAFAVSRKTILNMNMIAHHQRCACTSAFAETMYLFSPEESSNS
jgi:hypothetical protein